MCSSNKRRNHVLKTTTNAVEIRLNEIKKIRFLFEITVLGCPEPNEPPENGWIRSEADGSFVTGCHGSDETWPLTCKDQRWIYPITSCKLKSTNPTQEEPFFESRKGKAILGATILGCFIAFFVPIIVLTVLRVRMIKKEKEKFENSYGIMKLPETYPGANFIVAPVGSYSRQSSGGSSHLYESTSAYQKQ